MLDAHTDEELVAEVCKGDLQAYRTLVERHQRRVYDVAIRILGNSTDAEDAVQETFIRAYDRLKTFDNRAAFGTWLYRVAVNVSYNASRSRGRRMGYEKEAGAQARSMARHAPRPELEVQEGQLRHLIIERAARLPTKMRETFLMHDVSGMSHEEIANAVGCSVGTVWSRVFYARRKLRVWLSDIASEYGLVTGEEQ